MKISIVMPSYNQGQFIREAIDSVLQFEHLDIELIVMDGGSTDETVSILESYGEQFNWVSQSDDGQSWAINEGFRKATGDIFCWLNSDDVFEEDALDLVLDAFKTDASIDFVYGRGQNIDINGNSAGDSGVAKFELWELIHRRNFLHQPSCFFSKNAWNAVGGLDESLHYVMDWDLWIKLSTKKNVFIDKSLSKNRTYIDNKTNSGGLARWKEIYKITVPRSHMRFPPVLFIYGCEMLIQYLRLWGRQGKLENWLSKWFMTQMSKRQATGIAKNGAMTDSIILSVGDFPNAPEKIVLDISPLATIDKELLDLNGQFKWKSNKGESGSFQLNSSERQSVIIMLKNRSLFQHITIEAESAGISIADERPIVGYLDDVRVIS